MSLAVEWLECISRKPNKNKCPQETLADLEDGLKTTSKHLLKSS